MDRAALRWVWLLLLLVADVASAAWYSLDGGDVVYPSVPSHTSAGAACAALWVGAGYAPDPKGYVVGYTGGGQPTAAGTSNGQQATTIGSCRGVAPTLYGSSSEFSYASLTWRWAWCVAGSAWNGTSCVGNTCPALGSQMGSRGVMLSSSGSSFALCIGGCVWAPDVSAKQADGTWTNWGPYSSIGVPCTGAEGGSGVPAPAVCAAPQCPGTVNGTAVCLPCGEVREPPAVSGSTSASAPAGAAPVGSVPGSTSTTEQTSCSGGDCTTTRTTTTVGTGGTQSSQTTTNTQPIGTFCASNPGAAVCAGQTSSGTGEDAEPSTWGGSCAGFSCGGDAVQCAIAQEQHRRNCALFDTPTTLSQKGVEAASGVDPSDHPRNSPQNVPIVLSSMLDTTPVFGSSGGCPSDYSFAYAGQTLVIPFSHVCDVLHMLGVIWMGICYLVAASIVFRR